MKIDGSYITISIASYLSLMFLVKYLAPQVAQNFGGFEGYIFQTLGIMVIFVASILILKQFEKEDQEPDE